MKKVTVVQSKTDPIPTEVLATSIKSISDGIKKLRAGRLNDKALLLLIQHACPSVKKYGPKPGMGEVRAVLEAMENLERTYLKKESKDA